jgi:acyl-CoA synthetase (AMP-forming)/AMP-acid ligase II
MRWWLGAVTFVELLRRRSALTPRRRAFTFLDDDSAIDYGNLDSRARTIAALLQAHGAPGDRALLVYPPGLEFIAALFGCLYAGWIAVPTYPPSPKQTRSRFAALVRDAQSRAVLTVGTMQTRVLQVLEDSAGPATLATDTQPTGLAEAWRPPNLRGDDVAILQYTSGSTNAPRGVMVSHANLLHNTCQIERRFEIHPDSRGVIWLPPFHDMGLIGGILQGVHSGFPIALMSPAAFLRRPARWLEAIDREKATISGGPNFAYDLCVERIPPPERAQFDLSSWEVAFNGAEPIHPATLERFCDAFALAGFRREAFYPCYGLAEATLMVTGGAKSETPSIHDGLVSCGRAIADASLVIVDPVALTLCAPDQIGEVWVRGPSVAQGYWRQPETTREVFDAWLADRSAGPFLRTGDLGYLKDGELYVTGRVKSMLILGGLNVHAEDVEQSVAASHTAGWPGGVAAFGVEYAGRERLVIFQELRVRVDENFAHVARAIRLAVAEQHQIPVWAVVLLRPGKIPRTSSGKVRRPACAEAFQDGSLNPLFEWRQ